MLSTHWENLPGSKGAGTLVTRSNFKSSSVFHENLIAIQTYPLSVFYDKPLYVGFMLTMFSYVTRIPIAFMELL